MQKDKICDQSNLYISLPVYIYIHRYIYMCVGVCSCMFSYGMDTNMYTHTRICICICVYININKYKYKYKYIYIYICTYLREHVCVVCLKYLVAALVIFMLFFRSGSVLNHDTGSRWHQNSKAFQAKLPPQPTELEVWRVDTSAATVSIRT